MYVILALGTALKLFLFLYCNSLKARSDSIAALAEDHFNDVLSNLGAIVATLVIQLWPKGWWVDPVAAIIISFVIIWRWAVMTYSQVR